MSFEAMAWAVKQKVGNSTAKFTLLMIANYADEQGRAWPSQERLGECIEASRHTVMRALEFLEEAGFLTREKRHRADGSRAPDVIRLDLCSNLLRSKTAEPMSQIATADTITEPIRPINKKTRARGERIPEDWRPSPAALARAQSALDAEALEEETTKFLNYWLAKAGADAAKLDWNRTFENWIINAKSRRPTHDNRSFRRDEAPAANAEAQRRRAIYEAHRVFPVTG